MPDSGLRRVKLSKWCQLVVLVVVLPSLLIDRRFCIARSSSAPLNERRWGNVRLHGNPGEACRSEH